MRRRWRVLLAILVTPVVATAAFIAGFEVACRGSDASAATPAEPSRMDAADHRPEAQSWLTYPEWYIVYSSEAFARTLESSRPSQFGYARDVRAFWGSYCAVNRATAGMADRTTYKVTIYTIGFSYTAELAVKAAYEWTLGRAFEWGAGYPSAADLESARLQAEYGRFLHETPWYAYPFGDALDRLWSADIEAHPVRHIERLVVLSVEYGAKSLYGRVLGAVVGATGQDQRTMRLVARADARALAAVDPRLAVEHDIGGGLVLVTVPRYEQFTDLTRAMARAGIDLVEIAGNDDIFVTLLASDGAPPPTFGERLFATPVQGAEGEARMVRVGVSVRVTDLLELVRAAEASGARLEHVYDY